MADSTVRQRKTKAEAESESESDSDDSDTSEQQPTHSKRTLEEEDEYTPWVDILRVITFLILASCGLSYVISGGESWWWGMQDKPDYLTVAYWQEKLQGPPPPLYLTLDELAQYDGTDEEKPVYIAINGTIFDVSNGRHIYGPGGSYHTFAGVDAARSFITGCFQDDQTADLRGVERMFLPVDDPEIDKHWSEEEMAALKVRELEHAKQQAFDALNHWIKFFTNKKKYGKVGYLVREEGWLEKQEPWKLCDPAEKGRKKRKIPGQE